MRRIPELDSLRGLAAVALVFHHTPWLYRLPGFGPFLAQLFAAFDLFFVLSGYLITSILLDQGAPDVRFTTSFYARRLLRIGPLYLASLLIALAIVLWEGDPFPWDALPYYLTFTQHVPYYWSTSAPTIEPFGPSWSVAVVAQFYLVWPVLIGWLGRRAILPLTGLLMVLGLVLRSDGFQPQLLLTRCDGLALGALLAALLHRNEQVRLRPARYLRAFGLLAALALSYPFWGRLVVRGLRDRWPGLPVDSVLVGLNFSVSSLSCCALVGLAICGSGHPSLRLLRSRSLRHLGAISYGITMYHSLYFQILEARVPATRQTLAQTVLVYAVTLATAIVSWSALEEPFLELKRWFPYRRPDPSRPEVLVSSASTDGAP